MSLYRYKWLGSDKQLQTGQLQASSWQDAFEQLKARDGMLVELKAVSSWRSSMMTRRSQLQGRDLLEITEQLATLLGAGQTLEWSLSTLVRQTQSRSHTLLKTLLNQIQQGESLSHALKQSGQFSTLYLAMIRAGESSGTLADVFKQLAVYLEKRQKLRSKLINALIYPAFLMIGVFGSILLLIAYVVPQFVPIFIDLNVPLPFVTRVLMHLGSWLNQYGLIALALVMGIFLVSSAWLRQDAARLWADRQLLRIKGVGSLIYQIDTSRFCQTLGTLLEHQVALLPAMAIAREVCLNRAFKHQINQAQDAVKNGVRLTAALTQSVTMPALALRMIEVGERSGEQAAMLLKASDIFDERITQTFERMLTLLVPILTVVMAVLVAVIMLAIMLPLMSLTNHI